MPLVAHNKLPSFDKLRQEGLRILEPGMALHQDIRELHIGLLNMMPDAALEATERQFFRLIGRSNPIAQFFVHPFTLDALPRSGKSQKYINEHYDSFDSIKEMGLDALIITGANVVGPDLTNQTFWQPLIEVADWADKNVTSTLCSCLATHAVMKFRYQQSRAGRTSKKWGVFEHKVLDAKHPLVADINSRFDVPHSRWNNLSLSQFEGAGLKVLVAGEDDCVHLATSPDGFRTIFFQGHPEYDTISLLKEYKREVSLYFEGETTEYPCMPENYFGEFESAVFREYQDRVDAANSQNKPMPEFPEELVIASLDNTWQDTASAVVGKWMGLIYQLTNVDRTKPFMEGIDRENPLGLGGL